LLLTKKQTKKETKKERKKSLENNTPSPYRGRGKNKDWMRDFKGLSWQSILDILQETDSVGFLSADCYDDLILKMIDDRRWLRSGLHCRLIHRKTGKAQQPTETTMIWNNQYVTTAVCCVAQFTSSH